MARCTDLPVPFKQTRPDIAFTSLKYPDSKEAVSLSNGPDNAPASSGESACTDGPAINETHLARIRLIQPMQACRGWRVSVPKRSQMASSRAALCARLGRRRPPRGKSVKLELRCRRAPARIEGLMPFD